MTKAQRKRSEAAKRGWEKRRAEARARTVESAIKGVIYRQPLSWGGYLVDTTPPPPTLWRRLTAWLRS